MTDIFSKNTRSHIMKFVNSKGNKTTELRLIKVFKVKGIIGWRRNYHLLGNPDFVFPKKRLVVFADGCFWHGHSCRNTKPKDNAEFWNTKFDRNRKRDKFVSLQLKLKGWDVFRIWECDIKREKLPKRLIDLLSS